MRMNPQETVAKNDKARDVLDCVRGEIMDLDPVHVKKCTEERMKRECETSEKMISCGCGTSSSLLRLRKHPGV